MHFLRTRAMRNLFAPNFWIRRSSQSALTKFNDWLPTPKLMNALVVLPATDPLLMPDLVFSQLCRTKWEDWSVPTRLMDSHGLLARWSVLETLDSCVHFPPQSPQIVLKTKSCLSRLQQDGDERVRNEADYLRAKLDYFEIMPGLDKLEKRRRSKAMDAAAPKLRFGILDCHVSNELHARNKADFTLAELHEYVDTLPLS